MPQETARTARETGLELTASLISGTLPDDVDRVERLCLELSRLGDQDARRRFMQAHGELLHTATLERLAEAVQRAYRSDVGRALLLADARTTIAAEVGDGRELALALRAKANGLWLNNQFLAAADLFEQAEQIFEALGEQGELARTLSTSIQSLLLLGRYDRAQTAAARARDIFLRSGDTFRLARLQINVANIFHRQNRISDALEAYESAWRQLLPHKDYEAVAVALHNVAVCRIASDDFSGALAAYDRMRSLDETGEMPLLVAQADYNSAFLYFLRGEFTKALDLLHRSRTVYGRSGDEYHLALCDLDQSEIYLELGMLEEAEIMAQASLARFEHLRTRYEIGRARANLAMALGRNGDAKRAAKLFAQAKRIFRGEKNLLWPSLLNLYQAMMWFELGELDRASRLGRAAAGVFQNARSPGKHATSLILLAQIALRKGKLRSARNLADQATEVAGPLEMAPLAFEVFSLRGEIAEASNSPREALRAFGQARNILEGMRSSLISDELKIGLMKSRVEVYQHLTRLAMQQARSVQASTACAFRYTEESRSRSLRDLLASGSHGATPPEGVHPAQAELIEIRRELNWYYRRIEREELSREGIQAGVLDQLRERARTREIDLLRLSRELEEGMVQSGQSRPCTLAQVRRTLGPHRAILQFFYSQGQVHGFAISRSSVTCLALADEKEAAHRARLLRFQMNKPGLGRDYRERFQASLLSSVESHLRWFFDHLVAPLLAELHVKQLVIVPSGVLHGLPFHAFVDGQGCYLTDRFAVVYASSASLYALTPGPADDTPLEGGLVLGVESPTTPFVRQEVEAVAAAVPASELLMGEAATAAALATKGEGRCVVHIATHGRFRADRPMFSSIRLADSYISLWDLLHLRLRVDLLTLSGCLTGMNVVNAGDELVGLSRGLFFAGARSLLLSLWEVDDQSTASFMTSFYRELVRGAGKPAALQSAMAQVRRHYPHPYFWAAFQLVGSSASL